MTGDRTRHAHEDRNPKIYHQQKAQRFHSESGTRHDTETDHIAHERAWQIACRADQEIAGTCHERGKRNSLGVIEHSAVPRTA